MFTSWQERRTRNRLLMQELLLRAEANRRGAPGKSGPPTDYFRARRRRLLLRNPRFAIAYRRATKQGRTTEPGLGGVRPPILDLLEVGSARTPSRDAGRKRAGATDGAPDLAPAPGGAAPAAPRQPT